jgi:hypothetical protein
MRDHTAVEESMISSRTVPTTLAFVCALMLAGCATPVGVKHMSPDAVRESLTRNVLSQGKLSLPTENFLRRLGADEHYRKDPEQVLSVLHDTYVRFAIRNTPEAQTALVSLAEIAFHHASKADDPKYFLSAVAYAWAYLFPSSKELKPHPMDPRLRLAIDLYNRGISRAFADKDTSEIVFESGLFETGFGDLNIQLDDRELQWGDRRLSVFISVAEFEVRGLRNRYRWRGLGTPLAAVTEPLNPDDTDDFFMKNMRVPASAVMTFDDFDGQLESGVLDARMHLRVAYTSDSIEINGETIGLEMEPTSSFAFMLEEFDPWERELKGLFQGDLEVKGSGLTSLEPYRPGQIPVILVHGTASSAARWADILNDLTNDRRIREHYQFWLFTYNTGNPVAYSAWKLRTGIRSLVDRIDPEHRDSALDQIVVVGHSQGGLLTKMTVVDTGDVLWKMVSDRSIEEMDLEPESREILGGSLFVEPVPRSIGGVANRSRGEQPLHHLREGWHRRARRERWRRQIQERTH